MSFRNTLSFFANKDQFFILKPHYKLVSEHNIIKGIRENISYLPRFTLKNPDIFDDFPANTPIKYSKELIMKAIKYGMIIQIDYKGEKDDKFDGHNRYIYPMVLGFSAKGKPLLRAYHLKGWSVSEGGRVEKVWRLFRADRILNMTFSGAFFRLAPEGYNAQDKGIPKRLAMADFNDIRNLQQQLLTANQIDTPERIILSKISMLYAKDLNWFLNLNNIFANNVIPYKDAKSIRITFAKPIIGNGEYIAVIGVSVERGKMFKLVVDDKEIGQYTSIKWKMANELKNVKIISGKSQFKSYMFVKAQ